MSPTPVSVKWCPKQDAKFKFPNLFKLTTATSNSHAGDNVGKTHTYCVFKMVVHYVWSIRKQLQSGPPGHEEKNHVWHSEWQGEPDINQDRRDATIAVRLQRAKLDRLQWTQDRSYRVTAFDKGDGIVSVVPMEHKSLKPVTSQSQNVLQL